MENESCKFKFSSKLSKRAPAFITDFPNGKVKLNEETLKFECFKSDADSDKIGYAAHRYLLGNNGRTNYRGAASKEPSTLRYFVGVRNKITGKMKLYDSAFFRMRPDIEKLKTDIPDPAKKTYWDEMNDLAQSFGSKTKKRAMNARLKCTFDSVIDENMNLDALTNNETSDRPILLSGSQNLGYLPSKNHAALTPDAVFDINEIVSPEEYFALDCEARSFLNASDEELSNMESHFCNFVVTHLKESNIDFEKAKFLVYYNYLIKFQQLKYADIRKRDPCPEIPQPFKQKILNTFTSVSKSERGQSSRAIPQQMKDKLIAHILVLALFIDDFYVNTSHVLSDLNNVGAPKFITIAQALGCHISNQKFSDQIVKYIHLKLPLYELMPKYAKKLHSSKS